MKSLAYTTSRLMLSAALIGAGTFSTLALADDDLRKYHASPAKNILSTKQVVNILEKNGYKRIHDIELDDGLYEAEAYNRKGQEVDIKLHPVSGKILRVKIDD
ncbi:MAG: PepSY domain-containing protein [Alcaligenaceae bacterium]|nr:PepSY domain-containing protein [Alcaligenaceae bacterium]